MDERANFLKLLHSPGLANISIAMELAKGNPVLQGDLTPYLRTAAFIFHLDQARIKAHHIEFINQPFVNLEHHDIQDLPASLASLPTIQELDLTGNWFKHIPQVVFMIKRLKKLWVMNNYLTDLPVQIEHLEDLETLDLRMNQLTHLPPEIGKLTRLRDLLVNENYLKSLPSEIGNLEKLEGLYLSDNAITEIPSAIGKLKNLRFLCLDNNKITELPEEIGQLTQLEELRIQNNQLQAQSIPKSIEQLSNLKAIYYSGNPTDRLDIYLPNCSISYHWNDNTCP